MYFFPKCTRNLFLSVHKHHNGQDQVILEYNKHPINLNLLLYFKTGNLIMPKNVLYKEEREILIFENFNQ